MEPSPARRSDLHFKLARALKPDLGIDWALPMEAALDGGWADPDVVPVYFQPGPDDEMPAEKLIYEYDGEYLMRADNGAYVMFDRYQVTFVRQDPDSPVKRRLSAIQYSSFSRHYATSGLNHDVYVIYHQ